MASKSDHDRVVLCLSGDVGASARLQGDQCLQTLRRLRSGLLFHLLHVPMSHAAWQPSPKRVPCLVAPKRCSGEWRARFQHVYTPQGPQVDLHACINGNANYFPTISRPSINNDFLKVKMDTVYGLFALFWIFDYGHWCFQCLCCIDFSRNTFIPWSVVRHVQQTSWGKRPRILFGYLSSPYNSQRPIIK